MKPASDYAVNFPYGATSAPYSSTHPHRGNDRACPTGTLVVIAGTTIGLTGSTGASTGPHLHIQEWQGNTANTRKPQNEFKPGTVTQVDPNGTTGDGSFGKYITIKTDDGWNDSYCHLSQVNVKVGDKIGGPMGPGNADNYTVQALAEGFLGRTAQGDQNLLNNVGQPVNSVIDTFRSYPEAKVKGPMSDQAAQDLALQIGLALLHSEEELKTVYDIDYQWKHIQAEPNTYPTALLKQKMSEDRWQQLSYKSSHYDADVKAAYEKGKAEGGDGNYVKAGELYVKA